MIEFLRSGCIVDLKLLIFSLRGRTVLFTLLMFL